MMDWQVATHENAEENRGQLGGRARAGRLSLSGAMDGKRISMRTRSGTKELGRGRDPGRVWV